MHLFIFLSKIKIGPSLIRPALEMGCPDPHSYRSAKYLGIMKINWLNTEQTKMTALSELQIKYIVS